MDFLALHPEFKNVDSTVIESFLKASELLVSKKAWGKFYELGLFAYTAHQLAVKGYLALDADGNPIFNNGETFKSVASKTAGGLSISYSSQSTATASATDYDLTSTSYGLEYLRLRGLVMPFGVFA